MYSIVPTNVPFTSDIYEACVKKLAKTYPCLDITSIGTSRKGQPIYSFSLGWGPVSIMYNAAHHANEWITAVVLARFVEDMAQEVLPAWQDLINGQEPGKSGEASLQSGSTPTPWYEQITLHMVPMVNPDGVDIAIAGRHDWKANAVGVDLNSNYPAGWDLAREFKYARGYTEAGARDFVGQHPLSEPESTAMAAYTTLIDPALTLSLHTQGEVIYWRYMDYTPPGDAKLARRLSYASGYELEDVPDTSSHAGYRDWFIQEHNRPGFTIECGYGESPLPISDFDGIYAKVRPLMVEALIA